MLGLNERGGIVLDRTVFYAAAGGQPGDKGLIETDGGGSCPIATTVYDADKTGIVHVARRRRSPASPGQTVRAVLDWDTRHKLMRMHTCLHLLCSLVKFPVTGGQVGTDDSRLDFDIEDASAVDKDTLTRRPQRADRRRSSGQRPLDHRRRAGGQSGPGAHHVGEAADGHRPVRLVAIGENGSVDLQPCGGTHVKRTGEIGRVAVTKIENKGKMNRRIRVAFAITEERRSMQGPSKWIVETDWLAEHLDAPGPRRARRLHAPAHRQARCQGRISGRAHSRRAVLQHRRDRRRDLTAAAHAAVADQVRQPHEEDGHRRRHAR